LRLPGALDSLVRENLPQATVRQLVGRSQTVPGTFVDESMREHLTDVLVRVRLRGRQGAYVYVLIEHKRVDGREVVFQLLRYLAQIYERLARQHRGRVPAVVPLVVYNGSRPWRGPRRFRDVVEPRGSAETVDFRVQLLDVAARAPRALSGHRALRGGLLGLKVASSAPWRQQALARQAVRALDDGSTRRLFVRYIALVGDRTAAKAAHRALIEASASEETEMETYAELLKRRGRAEGRTEGRAEGLRAATLALLKKRFKRLPPTVTRKLEKATAAVLLEWHSRAIDARTLAAVFKA